ncbi:cobalamin biosynthesis protein [uncultured Paraglaciecola sp.]|uniref:cobalamin biosynthesis protein CobD/CbiB n=1 Tax=uncultured Paraglaciecola sp. TaxID=1765024 RepID=UPI0030DCCE12|tara:strand:- start:66104 stop:67066 length:963 start_codon:yes stop_codon:yes gene_type:complete
MNSVFNTLLSEQLLPFWVLLFVIFVERYLPWPDKYHPLSFIKALAMGMQLKVLSNQTSSIRQQKLSGSLACIVLLLPFYVMLAVFKYLSEYPIFFDALMLLVALRFQDIAKQTSKVTAALTKQKKMLARHALSQIVLRETATMSPLGMVKANIESLLLRYSYQYCTVIFWYLLTGGVGALIYRFIYEMSLCWNNKLAKFKYFGQPVRYLANILQWLPSKLASLSVIVAVNISQGAKALFQRISYQCNHLFVLNLCGASLGIELGGPAYYEQKKVRTIKCGGYRQVILADNKRTLAAINRATWVWMTLYFLGCALRFLLAK